MWISTAKIALKLPVELLPVDRPLEEAGPYVQSVLSDLPELGVGSHNVDRGYDVDCVSHSRDLRRTTLRRLVALEFCFVYRSN